MPGRLVCFFSVGVNPRELRYQYQGVDVTASFVLEAVARAGLIERGEREIVFAPILTPETLTDPWYKRSLMEAFHVPADCDPWRNIEVTGASARDVRHVIDQMLTLVEHGDDVFIEPTNGLRSLAMGMIAGAFLIRALRDDVNVKNLLYGEVKEAPVPRPRMPSGPPMAGEIHDISSVLDQFDWARDAQAFASALDLGPLLERLPKTGRAKDQQRLRHALVLGLTPGVTRALRGGLPLKVKADARLVEAESVELVQRKLGPMLALARATRPDTLDLAWLDHELRFCQELTATGRLATALMTLREWCVNVVLYAMGQTDRWYLKKRRQPAEAWLGARSGVRSGRAPAALAELTRIASEVVDYRNQLMHAAYSNGEDAVPADFEKWWTPVPRAVDWWASSRDNLTGLLVGQHVELGNAFLNLTNHPCAGWSEAQRQACMDLGAVEIRDLAFPAVDPAGDEDLDALASQVLGDVPAEVGWALVQGEPVLTVHLVQQLQRRGVSCFVATTRREVEHRADGKLSRFTFQRLRAWPDLAPQELA